MNRESLRKKVGKETWQQCSLRLKKEETFEVLRSLFDYIADILADRISDVKTEDGKTISFFSDGGEFLTINVTRKDLRIYIHPKAKAFFDPQAKFAVERFRFWDGSFQKATGKYRGMSVWISEKKYLPAVKKIVDFISRTA
jgi:hypothetical protein